MGDSLDEDPCLMIGALSLSVNIESARRKFGVPFQIQEFKTPQPALSRHIAKLTYVTKETLL